MLRKARPPELLIRFVFGGGIALVAAIAGSVFGPRFGGLFLWQDKLLTKSR